MSPLSFARRFTFSIRKNDLNSVMTTPGQELMPRSVALSQGLRHINAVLPYILRLDPEQTVLAAFDSANAIKPKWAEVVRTHAETLGRQ